MSGFWRSGRWHLGDALEHAGGLRHSGLGNHCYRIFESPAILQRGALPPYAGIHFPIGLGGVAMLVIHYGDRFFLQRSASLADVGIYSLAYKLGMW